ncbi:MAG: hypothetical protein ACRC1U_00690 [Vibrionaceae bacterium]
MQIFEQQIHKLALDESEEQEWLVAQAEKNAITKKLLLSQQVLISVDKTALPEKIMSYDEFYRLVPVPSGVLPDLTSQNTPSLSATRKGPRMSAQNSNVQLKFSSERNPLVTKMLHERNEQEKAHAQAKDKKKD